MENKKAAHAPEPMAGSGSAEQTGKSRDEQKNRNFNLDDDAKANIADDIQVPKEQILT